MSYLTLDADRLVRDAVDAYLEGRMRPDSGGDCVFATRNSQYRVVEGTVMEASDTSLMGAELVAWLVEELGQPLIEARWRPYGRAIFVERRSRHVVVTSRTLTRNAIGGNVSPVPKARRRPSVIPAAPPIPVLRSSMPPGPMPDGSPTPFRVSEALRDAARAIDAAPKPTPKPGVGPDGQPLQSLAGEITVETSAHERPTSRPPSDEATITADRGSYEDLLEISRTPTWDTPQAESVLKAVPAPKPPQTPIHLPPVKVPPPRPRAGGPPLPPAPPTVPQLPKVPSPAKPSQENTVVAASFDEDTEDKSDSRGHR